MAYSQIEDKYLSALTAAQFPDVPIEEMAPGQQSGDVLLAAGPNAVVSDAGGAAFGIYPGMGKRSQKSDIGEKMVTGAPDFAAGAARGAATSALGFGGDIQKIGRFIGALASDNQGGDIMERLGRAAETMANPTFFPSSTDVSEGGYTIPGTNITLPGLPAAVPAGTSAFGMTPEERQRAAALGQDVGELVGDPLMLVKGGKMAVKGAKIIGKSLPENVPVGLGTEAVGGMDGVLTPQLAIERVPGVKPGDELIVQHNLTASNLLKADKMGGLPVPSLAISKVGTPLENFGEITLIAPRYMASPSAKNPVFRSDAYTSRFPSVDFQFDNKSSKNLDVLFADTLAKIPDAKSELSMLKDEWKDRSYSRVMKAKFLDEQGLLPDSADFKDRYDFYAAVQTKVNDLKSKYDDWVDEFDGKLVDAGVIVKERIFKGYTYSGNRRYAAATLDNIVKEMKGGAGGENFNYGVGNLRAVATPKFKTLNQIKASRGSIVDSDKMQFVKNQAQEAYVDLLNRLREVNKDYSAEDALLELAQSKRISTLDRIYDNKLPDALKADIGVFLNKVQELPTEYFEMKPQRAVSLEEFKGAIIPKDTPQAARDVLKKAGITEIHEYSTPEERKSLFAKFGKEMFATMPAIPAGQAIMQDKEQK